MKLGNSDLMEVEAESVEDYLNRHYRPERFRGRGEEYATRLIASYQRELEQYGYCLTSHHDTIYGRAIVWYGPKTE